MTASTRSDILAAIAEDSPFSLAATTEWYKHYDDQGVMDVYLKRYGREKIDYEAENTHRPELYAVLATAEYHQHWKNKAESEAR